MFTKGDDDNDDDNKIAPYQKALRMLIICKLEVCLQTRMPDISDGIRDI